MRILEARFHSRRGPEYAVVGYLRWRDHRDLEPPFIEVSASVGAVARAQLLSRLQYLVRLTSPGSYERLQDLHSEFWSFVDAWSVARGATMSEGRGPSVRHRR